MVNDNEKEDKFWEVPLLKFLLIFAVTLSLFFALLLLCDRLLPSNSHKAIKITDENLFLLEEERLKLKGYEIEETNVEQNLESGEITLKVKYQKQK